MKNWYFGLGLLVAYLVTFNIWIFCNRQWIVITGLLITFLLIIALILTYKKSYFVNKYDLFWHGTVIFDIIIECLLIPIHDHHYFYLCALAFVIVVGGYHGFVLRQRS